jgi:hypothetical protein
MPQLMGSLVTDTHAPEQSISPASQLSPESPGLLDSPQPVVEVAATTNAALHQYLARTIFPAFARVFPSGPRKIS